MGVKQKNTIIFFQDKKTEKSKQTAEIRVFEKRANKFKKICENLRFILRRLAKAP